MSLVTDRMIQAAFDWLQDNSAPAAAAKAERIRAEHNVKRVKARLFMGAEGGVAAREYEAMTHPDYEAACEREAEAVRNDELFRNERSKCDAIIEAWRTEQSNYRAMAKVA